MSLAHRPDPGGAHTASFPAATWRDLIVVGADPTTPDGLAPMKGLVAGAAPAYAQTFTAAPKVAPARLAAQKAILSSGQFRVAAASLEKDWDRIVADIITLTEIEAPPFHEDARGKAFAQMLKAAGMAEVTTDKAGNVYGVRKGTGGGPLLVVTGHLDTVFPAGTNVKVRREGNRLSAPGVGDDTASLPVILATGYAEMPPGAATDLPRLNKPFSQKALAEAVTAAMHRA